MTALTKPQTPAIRQCVNNWLATYTEIEQFTVSSVCSDIADDEVFISVDASKAVHNELARLETQHKLKSRPGCIDDKATLSPGVGRPPRVYWRNMIFKIIGK